MIAPPLIVWLQLRYGWQTTFIVTGCLGFLWLALWLFFYQPPEKHSWITDSELALIKEGEIKGAEGPVAQQGDASSVVEPVSLRSLLR